MCREARCKTCGKTTWAGCGQHIDSVKARVPAANWCPGHPEQEVADQRSWFRKLIGR
jgi:hypothetical protein